MGLETSNYKIIKIIVETPGTKTFRFVSVNGKPKDFFPGQFVFLYAKIKGMEIKRPYTIASSPLDSYLELTIKLVESGKMTTYFHNSVDVGDIFKISKPLGVFIYKETYKHIVLITGGSGIVPMKSIIKYCTQKKLDTKITLFYSCKKISSIIYYNYLNKIQIQNPNLNVIYTLTQEDSAEWKGHRGRFTPNLIIDNIQKSLEQIYYLCGPVKMVKISYAWLKEKGIPHKNIKIGG